MAESTDRMALSTDIGELGVPQIKRIWSSVNRFKQGQDGDRRAEHELDCAIYNALGISVQQVLSYLYTQNASFEEFERWIVELAGLPKPLTVNRLQTAFGLTQPNPEIARYLQRVDQYPPVLSNEDLLFWEEHGYVILKQAVPIEHAKQAENVIWELINGTPSDPASWYSTQAPERHGIMIEEIQNKVFDQNRYSLKIHKAFAQLWGTSDLWVSHDRCGFNPPQTAAHLFPGPDLHWDLDFSRPLMFSTQGILYLTDTEPEQGALTLVPGFHKHLEKWLAELDQNSDPQKQDLHALGSKPIGAEAGDLIIWHSYLPHGSRPNQGDAPRIVQYINMVPCCPRLTE
ncbi:phytanoyl-CoA dioxygenase family protein [Marinomonas mediterranea]|uniref:phytanoyl-CoA dioxygenase family protein n=1 Tax=Marinomonas mediterranea TaxID=119864 RepID=UPI00234B7442|nr:phytanoyl-CoA dioxygenase family protein [Marinomonas mediterranea]WCN09126.1 phytanoyl-CoA dioxygenase [Marinomonas mediterranea]WCN13205.1 phytanoyl-CoA dioxygenase [Marinomonas mediterranea]